MPLIQTAVSCIQAGGVIAYPTEAVFGLGCDPLQPHAIQRLLKLKQRPVEKGLILVASSFEQLHGYIDCDSLSLSPILASWPGPNTWIMPKGKIASHWITGSHTSIAVRVSDHPVIQALCESLNHPLVSTSANPQSQTPARCYQEVIQYFPNELDLVIDRPLGSYVNPSCIRDALTGRVLRK